jgi:Arm DNA-binding domain
MVQQKLTDALVRQLPLPEKHSTLAYHAVVAGFAAPITRAGARSYVLRYRVKGSGKERTLTIGSATDWSITAARVEARRLRRLVDQGGHPGRSDSQPGPIAEERRSRLPLRRNPHLFRRIPAQRRAVCSAAPRTPEQRQQQASAASSTIFGRQGPRCDTGGRGIDHERQHPQAAQARGQTPTFQLGAPLR